MLLLLRIKRTSFGPHDDDDDDDDITLRMSGVIGLGTLEEKETTVGAMTSVVVSVERIVAVGYLEKYMKSLEEFPSAGYILKTLKKQIGLQLLTLPF